MKKIIFVLIIFSFLFPQCLKAQENSFEIVDETFEAKVVEIVKEKDFERVDGSKSIQQNIELIGLDGTWEDRNFVYSGISEIDLPSNNIYRVGDKVLVNWTKDIDGNDQFYILNYIRRGYIYFLGLLFACVIILVGRLKGVRSLVSLIISFLIIIKFIIPQIISGSNPFIVSLIGSALILSSIIYITEGFNKKSHLAIISILISLVLTFIISVIFVDLVRLTGFSSEEATFLVGATGDSIIDFQGLLLAGILIGTLGVLDDAILGQIEAVNQIKKLNPNLSHKKIISAANEIGRVHLGAIVNTLFLAYAGVSLPLLVLFSLNQDISFSQLIDNEFITTEIVRTLTGCIGLALAFPITTFIAAHFLNENKISKKIDKNL